MKRLIKLPKVIEKTARKRSAIYDGMNQGTFPKPVVLGAKSVAWVESEIDAWIEARIAERDQRAA